MALLVNGAHSLVHTFVNKQILFKCRASIMYWRTLETVYIYIYIKLFYVVSSSPHGFFKDLLSDFNVFATLLCRFLLPILKLHEDMENNNYISVLNKIYRKEWGKNDSTRVNV